jgi:hypothetical protein
VVSSSSCFSAPWSTTPHAWWEGVEAMRVSFSGFLFFCSRNLLVQSNLAMKSSNLQHENHIEAKAKSLPLPGCQVGYKKSRIGFECFR